MGDWDFLTSISIHGLCKQSNIPGNQLALKASEGLDIQAKPNEAQQWNRTRSNANIRGPGPIGQRSDSDTQA